MSKLRTLAKTAIALGAVAGAVRYFSKPENRETVRLGAMTVGEKAGFAAGKLVNAATAAKDRVAAKNG